MNKTSIYGIAVSCLAGFLGGMLASQTHARASEPGVVRASKFELVNGAGAAVANWSVGPGNEIHFRFPAGREDAGLDMGVLANGRPFFHMSGKDGKQRLALDLDAADKPMFIMSDERWQGRVMLGFIDPDTLPIPPNGTVGG